MVCVILILAEHILLSKNKQKRKLTLLTSMYLYHFPSVRDKLHIIVLQSNTYIIPKYYLPFTVQE